MFNGNTNQLSYTCNPSLMRDFHCAAISSMLDDQQIGLTELYQRKARAFPSRVFSMLATVLKMGDTGGSFTLLRPNGFASSAMWHRISHGAKDEQSYLAATHAAEESVTYVESMLDYVDPTLIPDLRANETSRAYKKPAPAENPLNAWIYRTHLKASAAIPETGLLDGKTVAIKDTVSVAGVPMTCGTQPFHLCKEAPYPIPSIDAPVVSRILEAGAMITGTSTCENYCMSAMSCTAATGPVDNPWLEGFSAGGSSSGSAALVAINSIKRWREARGLPVKDLGQGADLAVGGDQGGSIRVPAAYCGIYGLKPTHGLVPYIGIASLLPMLDHAGPMASSVRDTALLLAAIAGYDGFDPRMTPETPLRHNVPQYYGLPDGEIDSRIAAGTWTPKAAATGLRIGILKEGIEIPGMDAQVADVVRQAALRFAKLGASVEEVSIPLHAAAPHIFTAAMRAYMADTFLFQAAPTSLSFPFPGGAAPETSQAWYETMNEYNPVVVAALLSGVALRDRTRYPESVRSKAIRHVHELRAAYDQALGRFDALVTPATPTVGTPHAPRDMGTTEKIGFLLGNTVSTMAFNVSGHPALAMPVGWGSVETGDGRLPVAMQVVGKRWDEQTVFLAAAAWEVGGMGLDEEEQ
ncbi:Uu.00g062300.m01.CDS01 [Anthostomella pinea]|uniref:Uu.00g062300.m01.CDS01 n=1 Tax=Anthostomella pinea TaxID=933095 RepID=A0AAI8VU01_9PEZI|nr:Uu.00g062300.m01.CDS01 [Anthostomella pinea]